MTDERYKELDESDLCHLTQEEVKQGWHYCFEFDGLLRNSNEENFKCTCNVYQCPPTPTTE